MKIKIADVMTRDVATCAATDSLNRAAQLMWDRRCGTVPIVDESGQVIGLVSDRDACMAAYTQGRRLDDIPIGSAMSHPVRFCRASDAVETAEDVMMAHGVRRLVVLDGAGKLQGIVSLDDIARAGAAWDGKGDVDLERVAVTLGEVARRSLNADDETPAGSPPEGAVAELVDNGRAALRTLRDEIRVDVDLAGKELRDRWRRLEARLHAVEVHAHESRIDAARNLAALIESAKQFRDRVRAQAAAAAKEAGPWTR
jgi:CBS-domain-containing membrane protein